MPSDEPGRPVLRVIRGDASAEEIAAILAVLAVRRDAATAAASSAARTATGRFRSAWTDRSRQLRAPLAPGPGHWRRTALPR
ncbi:MAG: acyl-CoA carboxylase subunit epsilon [Streptosporangiaceae bacterium]